MSHGQLPFCFAVSELADLKHSASHDSYPAHSEVCVHTPQYSVEGSSNPTPLSLSKIVAMGAPLEPLSGHLMLIPMQMTERLTLLSVTLVSVRRVWLE